MWIAIIATILTLLGIVWLGWALWNNWKSGRVKTWPRTDATVLQASVEVAEIGTNKPVDIEKISVPNNKNKYKARVKYRYSVRGQQVVSENFMYGKELFSAYEIKTLMAPLSHGQTISVLYNPDNIDEAYVYSNASTNWLGIWGGIALILLGLILFAISRRKKKDFNSDTSINLSDSPGTLRKEQGKLDEASMDIRKEINQKEERLNFLAQQQDLIQRHLERLRA